ncbi:MAG: hypothetical protein IKB34_09270 [Clostridia bacterium]|nr:hypothetical protein [Clostridia bacterium]
MEMPIYLFTGFLEAGKTKMMHETLADTRFQEKERTLILLCEEGIEEPDPTEYSGDVRVITVESELDITPENLTKWAKASNCQRILIEYNGMWQLATLYNNMPEDWFVYQEVLCIDSTTFATYNANMRQLVFDKLSSCSVVFFNRCDDNTDIMALHSAARAVARNLPIVYEYVDGRIQADEIEDPLPFDIDAPVIEIEDRDYAIWYRDMAEDMDKYVGKTLKFKGIVARDKSMKSNAFAFGRMVMTCCAEDTTFHGVVCVCNEAVPYENASWLTVTATLAKEKHKLYRGVGPVLHVLTAEKAVAPDPEVATFN